MHWTQLTCTLEPEQAEAFEEALMAAGASAVTMLDAQDQPIFEPDLGTTPLWQKTKVIGLFSAEDDLVQAQRIATDVYLHLTGNQAPTVQIDLLENEDWTRKWIDNFKPIKFGDSLWVCPSWCEIPDPDGINLLLDPGLAFGTGTHPTTALCLAWLDSPKFSGKTVVDYGCGSGILGIAALLLGAETVIAVDNDPQALIATRDNADRNNIATGKLKTYLPDEVPPIKADILIANILAKPLELLRDRFVELLATNGKLLLSGILETQSDALLHHYEERFNMSPPITDSGWVCLYGQCK